MESALERLKEIQIQPTILVHSGHGLQAFWLFDQLVDVSTDRQAAASRQADWIQMLIDVYSPYSIDSVSDLSRVMRLPGFINHKSGDRPVSVEFITSDGPVTTPDAI